MENIADTDASTVPPLKRKRVVTACLECYRSVSTTNLVRELCVLIALQTKAEGATDKSIRKI